MVRGLRSLNFRLIDKTPTDTDLLVTLSIFIHRRRQPPPPDTPEHAATLQVGWWWVSLATRHLLHQTLLQSMRLSPSHPPKALLATAFDHITLECKPGHSTPGADDGNAETARQVAARNTLAQLLTCPPLGAVIDALCNNAIADAAVAVEERAAQVPQLLTSVRASLVMAIDEVLQQCTRSASVTRACHHSTGHGCLMLKSNVNVARSNVCVWPSLDWGDGLPVMMMPAWMMHDFNVSKCSPFMYVRHKAQAQGIAGGTCRHWCRAPEQQLHWEKRGHPSGARRALKLWPRACMWDDDSGNTYI